jgi:hypothetical protein
MSQIPGTPPSNDPAFQPIPAPAGTPPATPPAAPPAPAPAPAPTPAPPADPPAPEGENEAAKFRRLFEAAQKKADTLEAAEQQRAQAEMTELQRAQAEAAEAKAKLAEAEAERLRMKVATAHGLSADAMEFLGTGDEAALTAQAAKLAGLLKAAPVAAGSVTQPAGGGAPTIDEQIAAAEKAGDWALSIGLKRQKAGLIKPAG